ncbi:MAG: TIR domain-containing protein, partial [Neomegalonema sp.]|nr:TIR domain-containing protein [Neomegalonema sp.]
QDWLDLDEGFELWVDWYEDRLEGAPWDWELMKGWVLSPVWDQDAPVKDVNAELARLRDERTGKLAQRRENNRLRVIVLGDGEAGKTTLVKALHAKPIALGSEPTTRGVDKTLSILDEEAGVLRSVREIPEEDGLTAAHFWDFGGQAIIHSTHKFFLRAGCLYLIVINGRVGRDPNIEAERWLDAVGSHGRGAPVMLVGSKADAEEIAFDQAKLNRKQIGQCEIRGFHAVSALKAAEGEPHYQKNFARFDEDLLVELKRLTGGGDRFDESEYQMLRTVETMAAEPEPRDFLPYAEFNRLCAELGMTDAARERLARRLDVLGVLIDFPQLPTVREYLLDPRWLTFGVFALLNDAKAKDSRGVLTLSQIADILEQSSEAQEAGYRYDAGRIDFLAKAMTAFRLAYRADDHGAAVMDERFVIPALLPEHEPEGVVDTRGGIAIRLHFTSFLPLHLFHALVVKAHADIAPGADGQPCAWRYGVRLQPQIEYSAEALVLADANDRFIEIHVTGADSRRYAGYLRSLIWRDIGRPPAFEVEERIRATPEMLTDPSKAREGLAADWLDYEQIRMCEESDVPVLPGKHGVYSVPKILAGLPEPEDDLDFDVFLSYSHAQDKEVRLLAATLRAGGLKVWYDSDLAGSTNYPDRLRFQIDQAKAVCVLWSAHAAESPWVRWEAGRAPDKTLHVRLDEFDLADIPPPYAQSHDIALLSDRSRIVDGARKLVAAAAAQAE